MYAICFYMINETYLYIAGAVALVSAVSFSGVFLLSLQQERLRRILFILVSIATGALLGNAILHLLPEAFHEGGGLPGIPLAILAGMLAFFVLEKFLRWHHQHTLDPHECHDCETCHDENRIDPSGPLILVADGLHNMLDGAVIAATFLIDPALGIAATIAITLHEIPQEIGDFGLLLHAGYTRARALVFNFISALGAGLGALLFIFAESKLEGLMPYMIAFAAGNFLYIAGSDLLPQLHHTVDMRRGAIQLACLILGITLMYIIAGLHEDEHALEQDHLDSFPTVALHRE